MKSIYVLWLRQVKKYFRSKARIIGSLGQPLLFMFAFGFGLSPVFAKAGEGNYLEFLIPGVIAMSVIFTAMFAGVEVIWDRQFGFLKETLVAPTSRLNIVLGRTLGGATVAVIQGILVFIIAVLAGFRPESWLMVILALIPLLGIALIFTSLGTAMATRMNDMQAFPIIMNFIMMPLFFLSGALFPLTGIPKGLKTVVMLNPLSYGVDLVRGILSGTYLFPVTLDIVVVVITCVVLMGIATALFNTIQA